MFDNEVPAVKVTDVLHLKWIRPMSYHTPARDFGALSYRKTANTEFITDSGNLTANDHSISFIPKNVSYHRRSSVDELYVIHFETYGNTSGSIQVFYPQNYKDYELFFEEIFNKWRGKHTGYVYKCNSILNDILYNINKNLYSSYEKNSSNAAERIAQIIEKNLSNPEFSLSSLPKEIGISEAYIRRKFAEKFNMPPKEYQMQIRLEYAKVLLQTGLFNVKETALQCGFTNEKYFSVLFKERFFVLPSEYRKKYF